MSYYTKKSHQKTDLTFQEILNLIAQKTNFNQKRCGSGYVLRCPAHDDKNPSLIAKERVDGKTNLDCKAGCHIKDICNAIGINVSDIYGPNNRKYRG